MSYYKVLLFSVLLASLMAFGQTGAGNQPSNPSPVQSTPVGNGLSWTGGTVGYYGEGPASGTLLSTPTATFDSPPPTAGISNAGRAGISDLSPVNSAVQSTLSSSTLVYSNVPPDMSTAISPATTAVSSSRPAMDLGPSFFSSQIGAARNDNPSLGEVAAHYKNLQPGPGLRTYTNADVRPPRNAANNENSVLAANMPPVLGQSRNGAAVSSGSRASAATQGTSAEGADNAGQSESQGTRGTDTLPATSTILPLLLLLGITSTGVGILLRRRVRRAGA